MKLAILCNRKPNNIDAFDDSILEWDDDETINAVYDALAKRFETVIIEADINVVEALKKHKPDFVFNIAEGINGINRESHIPAVLEMLNIPYTGSDTACLANTLDKVRCKQILSYHKIKTPDFILIDSEEKINLIDKLNKDKKYILKPCNEGSSKGILDDFLFSDLNKLKKTAVKVLNKYNNRIIIEEFLSGREFTAALLGNGKNLNVLPIVEIDFSSLPEHANPIYSYEAKWVWDTPDKPLRIFECPAKIDNDLYIELSSIAKNAFNALGCKDWCRIDIRLDEAGNANIIELNPLPGILPDPDNNSCFPKAARACGIGYDELVNRVLDIAVERYENSYSLQH